MPSGPASSFFMLTGGRKAGRKLHYWQSEAHSCWSSTCTNHKDSNPFCPYCPSQSYSALATPTMAHCASSHANSHRPLPPTTWTSLNGTANPSIETWRSRSDGKSALKCSSQQTVMTTSILSTPEELKRDHLSNALHNHPHGDTAIR